MHTIYQVVLESNLGIFQKLIPELERAAQNEFVRVYNKYCDEANSGITDDLNAEWNSTHEVWEQEDYDRFMANGYQQRIVNKYNIRNESQILDFYIDEEVQFTGCLKVDHSKTIKFYLKEIKS